MTLGPVRQAEQTPCVVSRVAPWPAATAPHTAGNPGHAALGLGSLQAGLRGDQTERDWPGGAVRGRSSVAAGALSLSLSPPWASDAHPSEDREALGESWNLSSASEWDERATGPRTWRPCGSQPGTL